MPVAASNPAASAARLATSPPASTSRETVTCAIVSRLSVSRSATTLRIPLNSTTWPARAGSASGAGCSPAAANASTSSVMIRLPGALGGTRAMSTPSSLARRRAAGDAGASSPRPAAAAGADLAGAAAAAAGAAPAAGCAAASSPAGGKVSPASPMRASRAPTGSSVPGAATTRPSRPEAGAGTTAVIFSVVSSNSSLPSWTASPSALSHLATTPFFIAMPSLGMRTSVIIGGLPLQRGLDRRGDALRGGDVEVLEHGRERHRRVRRGDQLRRRVQVVERLGGGQGGDVGRHRAARVVLVDHHDPAGLAHRGKDRLVVERGQGPRVDDLHLDAAGGQRLGRFEGEVDHAADGHHGGPVALALDVGPAELDDVLTLGHLAAGVVQQFVLEEHHRVVVADRGGEQPLGVRRGRRSEERRVG